MSAEKRLEAVLSFAAKTLVGTGWPEQAAKSLVEIFHEYEETGTVLPAPLLPSQGVVDPLEAFCRAHDSSSVSVQLDLLYPAALVHAGACGQGGWWVTWNGRGKDLAVPMVDHHIGLAGSGAGKTTMQNISQRLLDSGMAQGIEAVRTYINELSVYLRTSLDHELAPWAAELELTPDSEALTEFKAVRGILIRAIDLVTITAIKRVQESNGGTGLSDATVESVISLAGETGGAVMVRASEQDLLDNMTRYSASGQSSSLSVLTQGWDGDRYSRTRQASGTMDIPALVMSLSLMTQVESFSKTFNSPAGMQLLDKGVLGRAWLTRGQDIDPAEEAAFEASRFMMALNGEEDPGLEPLHLMHALGRISAAGAGTRALRVLEGRIEQAAFADKAAIGLGTKANEELKRIAQRLELLPGRAVSAASIAANGGAGELHGVVLRVPRKEAVHLESLFVVCKMLAGDDPILAPSLTRYVSHVVRIAGIRAAVAAGAGTAEQWEEWLKAGEVSSDWIADTAARVGIWWLRQHLSVTGALRNESVAVQARESVLRDSRVPDSSLEGLAALRMVQNATVLPMPVRDLSKKLAGWGGLLPESNRAARERAFRDMFTDISKRGSEYFTVVSKTPEGGGRPGLYVTPGAKYLDLMKEKGKAG